MRLLLVDAPETGSDCYADEARSFLREHLLGRAVRLEADARDKDQYERRLRYVWLGDELVNETLVREGFARVAVYESTAQLERLTSAEIAAKGASRGLWGACISGNCDGPVVITSLDKRAETVTVEASGVDLTGWSIHSEKGSASGQRYAFPRGFVLTGSVTVVSGVARFEAAPGRLWWTKEQVWNNNDDDDAQLFNAANKLVCEFDDGQ
ncbi:MAG: thermonuclease family protein [Dehalococcoidia bacterium]